MDAASRAEAVAEAIGTDAATPAGSSQRQATERAHRRRWWWPFGNADAAYAEERAAIRELTDLTPQQRGWVENRWLGQFRFFEKQAKIQYRYFVLTRVSAIILGALVPALVTYQVTNPTQRIDLLVASAGLAVSVIVALEAFFRFGEQWRHFRMITELLRIEGWLFIQLAGRSYETFHNHHQALKRFTRRTEDLYLLDIRSFPWSGASTSDGDSQPTDPEPKIETSSVEQPSTPASDSLQGQAAPPVSGE